MTSVKNAQRKIIVGIGGAGRNVLAQMGQNEGIRRVYVNSETGRFIGNDAEEVICLDRKALRSKEPLAEGSMARLIQICEQEVDVAIITGLSGFTSSRVLERLVDTLIYRRVILVVFKPFHFEQQEHFLGAQDYIARLEASGMPHIHAIDLHAEREAMPEGGTLEDLLHRANENAIELATASFAQKHRDILSDVLSGSYDQLSEGEVGKIRMVCQVIDVWIMPIEAVSPGTEHASYSRAIEGKLDCINNIGFGSITFRIFGKQWVTESERLMDEEKMFSEAKRLRGYCQHSEGVIVSCDVFSVLDLEFYLLDPVIRGVGVTYKELVAPSSSWQKER